MALPLVPAQKTMKKITPLLAVSVLAASALAFVNAQVTQEEPQTQAPDKILEELMAGNSRYMAGQLADPDIVARLAATADGQHPKAVILSCLDSRVPVEMVFDQGIGDIFVGRVAGNIENEDQLGSMEFATKLAGARLVMVLGHSGCGAVAGAIADAKLGNLTALLAKIQPAVATVEGANPDARKAASDVFLKKVTEQNVRDTVANIRKNSQVLAELEKAGTIKIVGAFYDLKSGEVTLLD